MPLPCPAIDQTPNVTDEYTERFGAANHECGTMTERSAKWRDRDTILRLEFRNSLAQKCLSAPENPSDSHRPIPHIKPILRVYHHARLVKDQYHPPWWRAEGPIVFI
jgi:hypothetical protein